MIGAGAAGLVSSIIFAGGHGEVVLIEQDKMVEIVLILDVFRVNL